MKTQLALQIAAFAQLGIAILNLFLVRILKWKEDLNQLPLLLREVFYVHSWFISLILTIFAVMTLQFGAEMVSGTNPACSWLAGCIGIQGLSPAGSFGFKDIRCCKHEDD